MAETSFPMIGTLLIVKSADTGFYVKKLYKDCIITEGSKERLWARIEPPTLDDKHSRSDDLYIASDRDGLFLGLVPKTKILYSKDSLQSIRWDGTEIWFQLDPKRS